MATIDTEQILKTKDFKYVRVDDDSYMFDENFARTKEDDDTWLYVDYGNLSKTVDYSILPRQKGKVVNTMIENELTEWTLAELLSMDTETVYEHFTSCFNIYSDDKDYNELDEFLEMCGANNIKTVRDSYVEFELSGYSQGDSVTVIVNPSEAEKVWGNTVENGAVTKDGLFQMFFDSTNLVRIDVMGAEFISEQDGSYEYDKDDLIKEMVEYFADEIDNMEYFEEQLEDMLPSEL